MRQHTALLPFAVFLTTMLLLCMGCCAQHIRLLWHVAKEYNRSAIVLEQSQQGHPQAKARSSHHVS